MLSLARVEAALDELGAVDLTGAGAAALAPYIAGLMSILNRVNAELERAVGVFDAQGMGEIDGAPSTAAWLRGRCRLAPVEASARVRTARTLRELPLLAAALERGEISFDHACAVSLLGHQTSLDDTRAVQRQLLDVARLTDPARFGAELREIREAVRRRPRDPSDRHDPDSAQSATDRANESDGFARRELSVTPCLDGFDVRGWLTDEAGALVRAVLGSLAAPLPRDPRTPAQRTADALTELCRRAADAGSAPSGHRVRPHLLVLVQLDDLLADARGGLADVSGGGRLGVPAARRIGCDAAVTRIVLDPAGQVLDLGRTARVVTPAQWKALVVRDGGCVFPFCDRPAAWCDAHHLVSWLAGGPTDLGNLGLMCGFHHRLVHEGGWRLFARAGQWVAVSPTGVTHAGRPVGYQPWPSMRRAAAVLNGPRGPCAA